MKPVLAHDLTVEELLTRYTETASVFVTRRMACVGCPMSPFETLEDAARVYGLAVTDLMRDLEQAVSTPEGKK